MISLGQSLGGDRAREQRGHRPTTGSSPEYQEPTPPTLPTSWDLEQSKDSLWKGTSWTLAGRRKPQCPSHLASPVHVL